jgi:hypothetical protein
MRTLVLAFLIFHARSEFTEEHWPSQAAPAPPARRRAVQPNPAPCTPPALFLTLSKASVCPGESVTLSWQASDSRAVVSIVGIGGSLPASGSKTIDTSSATVYSGRATNACGSGSEAVAEVKVQQGGTASLSASASSIQQGQTTALTVTVANVGNWTLSSALGNGLSASSGTNSRTVTYTGTRSGSDTITLTATGACGSLQRTTSIVVAAPPPLPPSGNLRCCDGTVSPTCNSCAKKQGCCSSHGGVCGCPP